MTWTGREAVGLGGAWRLASRMRNDVGGLGHAPSADMACALQVYRLYAWRQAPGNRLERGGVAGWRNTRFTYSVMVRGRAKYGRVWRDFLYRLRAPKNTAACK